MSATIPAAARVLELDVGNTRTKWRWLDADGEVLEAGALARDAGLPWPEVPAQAPAVAVRVVSVAGPAHEEVLVRDLEALGFRTPRFARAAAAHGRLRSGYREPERLGADRWVALVAATAATPGPCAVLDAGSAITFDMVAADGRHEGGWIVPGLRLMRAALLRDTAGVRFASAPEGVALEPGCATAGAVLAGTAHMARDFARARWEDFRARNPEGVLFVTGGDGPQLADGLEGDVRCEPDLVLDGLRELFV